MSAHAEFEPFDLFAVRYAHNGGRKARDNFIGGNDHDASDLDYFIWVARRSDRLFVIDTGFGPDAARQRNRNLLHSPVEALGWLGIETSQVDEVILTHLHFDHAGGLDKFPKARLHLQDAEAAFATGRCMCHGVLRAPFDVEDVTGFVRRLYAGQVCFHDGTSHLAGGLSLHHIGGHSAGLQAVRVWTRRGWVVIASDAAHLYENLRAERPFPIVHSVSQMLEGYRRLHELATSPDHIIPGHDPMVMAIYPAPAPELAGRVVRLDVAPELA